MDETHASPPSPTGTPSMADMLALTWATLGDMFGPLWSRSYGETPTPAWRATLSGLSADEVRRGLRAVCESGSHYPPSAPEFRAMCRPPDKRTPEQRAFYARIESEQRAALPAPESLAGRTRVGRRWLAFWWVDGIRPMPRDVTPDQIDGMLDGVNLDDMRRRVGLERSRMMERYR